jgi:hypothetical protein
MVPVLNSDRSSPLLDVSAVSEPVPPLALKVTV